MYVHINCNLPSLLFNPRNNLYWSHGLMLPVLWYGDASKLPEDAVEVQPIFCPIDLKNHDEEEHGDGANNGDGSGDGDGDGDGEAMVDIGGGEEVVNATVMSDPVQLDSTCTASAEVEVKSEGCAVTEICPPASHTELFSSSAPSSSSSSHSSYSSSSAPSSSSSSSSSATTLPSSEKRSVRRGSLTPLDDDLLQLYCPHKLTSHLTGAFLDFSEWDDHLRDSYTWSDHVTTLLRCVCYRLNVEFRAMICCMMYDV